MTEIHRNVAAVMAAAEASGLPIEPRRFPDGTRTAEDAAAAVGVDVAQIVKSLVFAVDGRPVVALVAGDNRLDEAKLSAVAGGGTVTRADADLVRRTTGFPIGGVPPFGYAETVDVYVDEDLLRHEVVWAAAGTPHDVFPVAPADLVRVAAGAVADLARRS